MSELMLMLQSIEKGLETGSLDFKQARSLFKETASKAFGEFDIEKVFWRSVYGVGFFFMAKIIYQIYVAGKLVEVYPEELPEQFFNIGWWQKWASPIVWLIYEWAVPQEEHERKRSEILEKIGIPKVLDDVMMKYSTLVMIGIPGLFGFLEYRRVKKLKEVL